MLASCSHNIILLNSYNKFSIELTLIQYPLYIFSHATPFVCHSVDWPEDALMLSQPKNLNVGLSKVCCRKLICKTFHRQDTLHFINSFMFTSELLNRRFLLNYVWSWYDWIFIKIIKPHHDKTNIMGLRPAWIQTSMRIRTVWSGSMLYVCM
jgi:hypothetical protein